MYFSLSLDKYTGIKLDNVLYKDRLYVSGKISNLRMKESFQYRLGISQMPIITAS